MQKIIQLFLCTILLTISTLIADSEFGYISYSTTNIGDDIQAIAAKRFLPKDSVPIDREFIGDFHCNKTINTIINGWYMHTKDIWWYRNDVPAPEKSWPPSPAISPLLISLHFIDPFMTTALSDEGVKYLKKHAPIGARDYHTLQALQDKGIPSYFSGCLTLTLEKGNKRKGKIIYAVDLDEECVKYIRSKTKYPVKTVSHGVPVEILYDNEKRLEYAQSLLDKYRDAKCVITARLHATMPCLALETPVLLIGSFDGRFDGLKELARHCTKEELLAGKSGFHFNRPKPNPKHYLPIRENLIQIVTNWVNQ